MATTNLFGNTSLAVVVYGPDGKAYGSPAAARAAGVTNYTMSPPAAARPAAPAYKQQYIPGNYTPMLVDENTGNPLPMRYGDPIYSVATDRVPSKLIGRVGMDPVVTPHPTRDDAAPTITFADAPAYQKSQQMLDFEKKIASGEVESSGLYGPALDGGRERRAFVERESAYTSYDPKTNIVKFYDLEGNVTQQGPRAGSVLSGPLGDLMTGLNQTAANPDFQRAVMLAALGTAGYAALGGLTSAVDLGINALPATGASAAGTTSGLSAASINQAIASGMAPGSAGAAFAAQGGLTAAQLAAASGVAGAGAGLLGSAALLPEYSINQAVASGMSPGSMGASLATDYATMGGAAALDSAALNAAYGVGGAGATGLLGSAAALPQYSVNEAIASGMSPGSVGAQMAAQGGLTAAELAAASGTVGAGSLLANLPTIAPSITTPSAISANQAVASGMSPGSIGAEAAVQGGLTAAQLAAASGTVGVGSALEGLATLGNTSALTNLLNQGSGIGSTLSSIGSTVSNLLPSASSITSALPSLITSGLQGLGAANTAEKAREAAQIQAAAQVEAARIAADAAKFRPVGVTTRFGASNFQTDAQGNVIGAGYTTSPELKAYQDRLSALAARGLTGAEGAQAAYAPLTTGAQSLFSLGQGYLQKTPEQQAADYIAKQQALLAPGQEQQLAQLQAKLLAQGRGGLSVAQGGNLSATSPELAAYYNALAQSNLQLAAQGQQAGMEQARFGAGLLSSGSDLMSKYYAGQTAAYSPFATAIDTSSGLESLAQQPLTLGTQIGAKTTASSAEAGRLLAQGMVNSAATQAPVNAFSYSGDLFSQAANNPQLQDYLRRAFGT